MLSCRYLFTLFFSLAALFCANTSHALTPESGWWWNSAESGRGFSIEIQDNTLFMAGFLYDTNGSPFWFTSAGRFNAQSSSFEGDMTSFRDGQCLTCSYQRPILQPIAGRMSLRFSTLTQGTLTWPNGSMPITRQIYGQPAGIQRMLGSYAFSTAGTSNRVHFGNWLSFSRTMPDASLGTVSVGATEGGRVAVAALNSQTNSVLILVDASTSFYETYLIPLNQFGTRGGIGLWSTYAKTSTPVIPSAFAHFSSLFSSAEIGAAPQSDDVKSRQTHNESFARETLLRSEVQAVQKRGEPAPTAKADLLTHSALPALEQALLRAQAQ